MINFKVVVFLRSDSDELKRAAGPMLL